jgi:glyoxylase-like metal-dependent hydrolase (beta-lactamase superfamily II)
MHRSLLALAAITLAAPDPANSQAASWDIYAVRYATLENFPVAALIAGADTARRMDIAMMVWVLQGDARVVLVDAGFYRDRFLERWKPADYIRPSAALAAIGVRPEDVTDIIVTHVHWDHADGVDLFPNARVWIQAEEYGHHVGPNGEAIGEPQITPEVAAMLASIRQAGRLMLVEGSDREILPGITVYTGGKHTFASQYVGVRTASGTAVIASDNLYLYENLDRRVAIAQTLDASSNLRAQERMLQVASDPRLIVPGHDPAVFERFPLAAPGVVRIR